MCIAIGDGMNVSQQQQPLHDCVVSSVHWIGEEKFRQRRREIARDH